MDSTILLYNGKWREKGSCSDSGRTHAEIANFSGLKSRPDNDIYGFIQGGAPCDSCTEFFKKQSAGGKTFVFVIEKGGNGKKLGGTGYPILPGTIILGKSAAFNKGTVGSDNKLSKSSFLKTSDLPAFLVFIDNNCYFGGVPAGKKITMKLVEDLLNKAT